MEETIMTEVQKNDRKRELSSQQCEELLRTLKARFDKNTKLHQGISWEVGGALFCDRRYDTVFLYHNGADSYYGVRGFRGLLRV
jgi:hypothetical protein